MQFQRKTRLKMEHLPQLLLIKKALKILMVSQWMNRIQIKKINSWNLQISIMMEIKSNKKKNKLFRKSLTLLSRPIQTKTIKIKKIIDA